LFFYVKQMEQQALVPVNYWRRQPNSRSCSHVQFRLGIYFSVRNDDGLDELLEWSQLFLVNQPEFIGKQNEVLEAGVKMSLLLQADNLLKM